MRLPVTGSGSRGFWPRLPLLIFLILLGLGVYFPGISSGYYGDDLGLIFREPADALVGAFPGRIARDF